MDPEQSKPLNNKARKSDRAQELLDLYNERSLVWEDQEKTVFLFDYAKGGTSKSEIVNRHVLKELKDRGQWRIIKHPLLLNFVNEKLLACTISYLFHILLYFLFLALLFSYVQGHPSIAKNLLVTCILLFFVFFMLIKAALKMQSGLREISFWFCISYLWTLTTYLVTLFFIRSWHLFSFDDFNEETKRTVGWFLPIVAILASWINCLYVLRKAPCGSYILMMSKILFSFLNTTVIWIPTLFTFAFAFQLVMRDSGAQPWDDKDMKNGNVSSSALLMVLFQSFTKTSAMMIGEVEANDILGQKAWIANFLLILFEIITVILLMNLMISLAVGDVNELRMNAEERLLKIKVNYCIEALHLSEQISYLQSLYTVLHRSTTNNVLVICKNEDRVFTRLFPTIKARYFENIAQQQIPNKEMAEGSGQKLYELEMCTNGLRIRKEQLNNKISLHSINVCTIRLVESAHSGIKQMNNPENIRELESLVDTESHWRKFQRWFIGLNWKALLF